MSLFYFPEHKLKFLRIPKNACSTVIKSLGYDTVKEAHPHGFDHIFRQKAADSDDWPCLAVLRDPFQRVVSAFLNKFTDILPEELFVHELLDYVWRAQRGVQRPHWRRSITFRELTTHLCAFPDEQLDVHWRSQSSFLDHAAPTIFFNMETLASQWKAHPRLSQIELRTFAPHATRSDLDVGGNVIDAPGEAFVGFKMICGTFPSHRQFRDSILFEQLKHRFAEDYRRLETYTGVSA